MHSRIVCFVAMLTALLSLSSSLSADPTRSLKTNAQELVFCGWSGPPFIVGKEDDQATIIGGAATTYFIELFNRIKGAEAQMRRLPFKRCLNYVESGEADGLFLVGMHKARKRFMVYTDEPFVTIPIVMFYNKKTFPKGFTWSTLDELTDQKIALLNGTQISPEFDQMVSTGQLRIEYGLHHRQNMLKLSKQRIDLMPLNMIGGLTLVHELGLKSQISYTPEPSVRDISYYISVSKKSPALELLPKINAAMAQMKDEGITAQIFATDRLLAEEPKTP